MKEKSRNFIQTNDKYYISAFTHPKGKKMNDIRPNIFQLYHYRNLKNFVYMFQDF